MQHQLHLKPVSPYGPAIWNSRFLSMSGMRQTRIAFGSSLKRTKRTFPGTHSKACFANHEFGPHQIPPPGPFGSRGYGIILRSVRLATDLEVMPTAKAGRVVGA